MPFKKPNWCFIEEYRVFTLSCPIEPFEINKQCSKEFNVGLINPWDSSLCNGFVLIFKDIINFHEYANEILSILLEHKMTVFVELYH